jgi:hypothetical protein
MDLVHDLISKLCRLPVTTSSMGFVGAHGRIPCWTAGSSRHTTPVNVLNGDDLKQSVTNSESVSVIGTINWRDHGQRDARSFISILGYPWLPISLRRQTRQKHENRKFLM